MKFSHRAVTGVKLALIGCTSALSCSREATESALCSLIVGIYLVHGTTSNLVSGVSAAHVNTKSKQIQSNMRHLVCFSLFSYYFKTLDSFAPKKQAQRCTNSDWHNKLSVAHVHLGALMLHSFNCLVKAD